MSHRIESYVPTTRLGAHAERRIQDMGGVPSYRELGWVPATKQVDTRPPIPVPTKGTRVSVLEALEPKEVRTSSRRGVKKAETDPVRVHLVNLKTAVRAGNNTLRDELKEILTGLAENGDAQAVADLKDLFEVEPPKKEVQPEEDPVAVEVRQMIADAGLFLDQIPEDHVDPYAVQDTGYISISYGAPANSDILPDDDEIEGEQDLD